MPRTISQEIKDKIIKDSENGYSYTDIAKNYGIPASSIKNILLLNRKKCLVLPEAVNMSKEEKEIAIKEMLENTSEKQSDIAAKYGVFDSTVSIVAKKYGLRQWKEKERMEYRNPEGYADPTAYKAINTPVSPGEIWTASTHDPDKTKTLLVLQIFDSHALCLWMTNDLSTIPEGCEEKVMFREESFCDCSKPQYAFFSRFVKRVGGITINRLIDIRQKVADIILRGYAAQEGSGSPLEAPGSGFSAEADKIPVETEKARETPVNGLAVDAGELTRLRVKAEIMEQVAGRLFGILEKQAERG